MAKVPKVNPQILIWARETAGLSQDEAARKLLSGADAKSRLLALEQGKTEPTRAMLIKMAAKYRRPLVVFYLPERPAATAKGSDFRTLAGEPFPEEEALLEALLREVQVRQELIKSGLEELDEAEPLAFVGSGRIEAGVAKAVEALRGFLGISLDAFRSQANFQSAFRLLRDAAERAGVFVLLMGNLGSHHSNIDVRTFRGFALADKIAPFAVINENDSRAAWSFTLLHELAHIWLGQTGVSGYGGEADVEKFCDTAAARFLLVPDELSALAESLSDNADAAAAEIGDFARGRNLSRKMVAYNLLLLHLIQETTYRNLCEIFDAEREAAEKSKSPSAKFRFMARDLQRAVGA